MRHTYPFLLSLMIISLLLMIGCSSTDQSVNPQQKEIFVGQLFGTATSMRDSIPEESRPEHFLQLGKWYDIRGGGKTRVTLLPNGEYEFRRTYPTDSLEIWSDSIKAEIGADGSFTFKGVTSGNHMLKFFLQGKEMRNQACDFSEGQVKDIDITYESMPCMDHGSAAASIAGFACLDYNGVGAGGFIYSDCWESLFFGPPWYNWMCWSEAMNRIHDHYGNIWCDGTHNCSLFVHGWDWNKQSLHRHYFFWWPQY